MGQALIRTITLKTFRGLDSLSGEVRVVGGSRWRRGARWRRGQASCKSLEGQAGSDAASGAAAGGSAQTSAAHAASRKTDAESAKPKAENAEHAPEKKNGRQKESRGDKGGAAKGKKAKGTANKKEEEKAQTKGEGGGGGEGGRRIESLWEERVHLDGGEELPSDGGGFVDAVNEYVDLVRLTDSLLRERDEKSSKSMLEKLLEMKYGKGTKAEAAGVRPIICDLPGPVRD